jgi:hypothetical protein
VFANSVDFVSDAMPVIPSAAKIKAIPRSFFIVCPLCKNKFAGHFRRLRLAGESGY